MTRPAPDLSVYVVTDRALARGRPLEDVVAAAIRGGATAIQLREKEASTREFLDLALRVRALTRDAGAILIVNDRIDVALAADADGAHVGQNDMPARIARRLLGPDRILGVSGSNPEDAARGEADGADYIGATVFATPTKADFDPPLGESGLRDVVRAVHVPVVAIGGIHAGNAGGLVRAGAAGVAVVSAVMSAADPEAAARELRSVVDAARAVER